MKQLDKLKEYYREMPEKRKKGLLIGTGVLFAFVFAVAILINSGNASKPGYSILFSGMNDQDSMEVMAKLQENGIDYQYDPSGSIRVPEKTVDKTRATLAMAGYPKSGFTYETFLNNTNMMSTEADKKSLKVWEMQDRLGATIRNIEGVRDAVVQIAPGESQKYVLDNKETAVPTASVMVTMYDGSSPTPEQVSGIQRLVAKSVANMDMGDVAVIDSNGIDVSAKRNDRDTVASDAKLAYEQQVEAQIEDKVLNVLEVIFGRNNVRVSVKCEADMQKVISEESGYTAPNTENNSGYIVHQELYSEGAGGTGAGGVPGADTNANIPQYGTNPGTNQNTTAGSSSTDLVVNEKKVQSQDDGGKISDINVAISINSSTLSVSKADLTNMVARAAGIDPTIQDQKIVIVNSSWYNNSLVEEDDGEGDIPVINPRVEMVRKYLPYIIAGGAGLIILLVLIIILLVARRRKKRRLEEIEEEEIPIMLPISEEKQSKEKVEIPSALDEKSKEMRESIRGFTEENPEISAQLLKNWLRGGDDRD